jgi:hypothetical protein
VFLRNGLRLWSKWELLERNGDSSKCVVVVDVVVFWVVFRLDPLDSLSRHFESSSELQSS